MEATYSKILVLVLLFIGEALSIYAEMVGARSIHIASQPFLQIFLKMFLLITIAGFLPGLFFIKLRLLAR